MKTSTAAFAVLFVAVLCYQVSSSPMSVNTGPCCPSYLTKPLPAKRAVRYDYTGSHCPQPAVIFTTVSHKMVCSNPHEEWVQNIVNQLKRKQAVAEQPSPP
ncbi:C-C motif chemokine 5-like [Dryobates pubescens]|uniref:C-C motif chemokine 5-like n=1 Tax=Dryobates pubescens TaxID=118200 RepID=UPI000521910D|nr:C-C motif chemokine 5-like [Dryobates pubescens]